MNAPTVIIWWCESHKHQSSHERGRCAYSVMKLMQVQPEEIGGCRMVEMRLVPVDALVLVRNADGEWPNRAVFELALMISTETNPDAELHTLHWYREVAVKCLDELQKRLALTAASQGEQ